MSVAFITGVNGQTGSYLAELLLDKGYTVIGLYRRSSTNTFWRIKHLLSNPNLQLECGDITDFSQLFKIVSTYRPNEIYNLAAISHVGASFEQPQYTWDVVAKGFLNLLEVIRTYSAVNIDYRPRIYQASSSEIFGNSYELIEGQKCQRESTYPLPASPYAVAKLSAHHLARVYRESYNFFICSGILNNHESYRRGECFVTRKITKFLAKVEPYLHGELSKKPMLELGNIKSHRDWMHAKDAARAIYLILQQDNPDDYVVAREDPHSVEEFLMEAFRLVRVDDFWQFVNINENLYRPNDVEYLCGYAKKALLELGWYPQYSFHDIIREMVYYDVSKIEPSR